MLSHYVFLDSNSLFTPTQTLFTSVDCIGLCSSRTQASPPQSPSSSLLLPTCISPPLDLEPIKIRTTPVSHPGDLSHSPNILIPYNYLRTPIWTSADDGKPRMAEYDPNSPTNLPHKLGQSTVTHFPVGKKALCPYVCAGGDGDDP